MNLRDNFNRFITKRGIILFSIFIIINILANIPSQNHTTEILSHFKLHYFYIGIIFSIIFLYLSIFNRKFVLGIIVSILIILINFSDLRPYFFQTNYNITNHNTLKLGLYNVLTSNNKYNILLEEIKKENPDIIILQEVDRYWLLGVSELKKQYPYYIEQERDDNFGIALYSKYPFINSKIEEWTEYDLPAANAKIDINGREIQIYGVHTLPPLQKEYFLIRNEMLKQINEIINNHSKNLIIAGDFNTTAFSPVYKKYIKATNINDAQTISGNIHEGSWNTYHLPILRITVEHILSTKDITPIEYKQGKFFGSDHFPVFVEFSL